MNQITGLKAGLVPQTATTRVSSLFTSFRAGLISKWADKAMIVDSAYAWNVPEDLSSIGMWVARMGQGPRCYYNPDPKDPNFDHVINTLYAKGQCAAGGYWVIDPRYWNNLKYPEIIEMNMAPLAEMVDLKTKSVVNGRVKFDPERDSLHFLGLDFEIKNSNGIQMTSSNLFYELPRIADLAHERWPRLKIGVYCNGDMLYTPGLCPQLLPWINSNSDWLWFWGAKWCYNRLVKYPELSDYAKHFPGETYKPLGVSETYNRYDLAQFGGDDGIVHDATNKASGGVTALDMTMFRGTKAQLFKELNFVPLGEVVPPPPPAELTQAEEHAILWREAGVHQWTLTK